MNKPIIISILIALLVLLFVFGIPNTDRKLKVEHEKLKHSELNGTIQYLKIKYHRDCIKLDNNNDEFVFSSHPCNNDSGSMRFSKLVTTGDRVIKKTLSDTLILVHNDRNFCFLIDEK